MTIKTLTQKEMSKYQANAIKNFNTLVTEINETTGNCEYRTRLIKDAYILGKAIGYTDNDIIVAIDR